MDPKQKSILIGAVMGGVIGALSGLLFARGVESTQGKDLGNVSLNNLPGSELVKILISTIALVRSIAQMGEQL